MITIFYVYYNTPTELLHSLLSIPQAIGGLPCEVIIVDNASRKQLPTLENIRSPISILTNKENKGYGPALNQGVRVSKGDYLLFVNTDTLFQEDAIVRLYQRIKRDKKIGVIGPQMRGRNGKVLQSYNGMPFLPDAIFAFSFLNRLPKNKFSRRYWLSDMDVTKEQEVSFVGGACMMARREVFDRVGGFDERFFMYFEEVDLCYKIKKIGYKILYYPKARVIHLIGKSSRDKKWIKKTFEESRFKFFQKYHGTLEAILGEALLRILNAPIKKYIAT